MRPRRLLLLIFLVIPLSFTGIAQEEGAPGSGDQGGSQPAAEGAGQGAAPASPLLEDDLLRLETESSTYVALGNSVVSVDPQTGMAVWRKAVSGPVTLLEETSGGVSVVTELAGGLSERITLDSSGRASTQVRFTTDPAVLHSLRAEAEVPDPAGRLAFDPTNPWLHLAAAAGAPEEEAAALRESAVSVASTFYDLAGVAGELAQAGEFELAGAAMRAALQDFARRGYDPHLLTDLELHEAYGFPLPRLQQAMSAGDTEAAAFWAGWTEAFLSPNVPEVAETLEEYADWLAARGETSAAVEWRARAQPALNAIAVSGMERLFTSIGRAGWFMFASLVVVILALQITLTFKYWEPQSLAMRRSLETGGRAGFGQRFLAIRFFSTTEKLVLALLYVAGLGVLGLTGWADRASGPPGVVSAGTLASAAAQDALDDLQLHGERGQFIRGYAAQVAGNPGAAELHYRAAPRFGPAINNLAVLTGDDELFEEAARQSPALPQIAWNLGDEGNEPAFDRVAGIERAALVVPGPLDFRTGLRGSWQQALSSFFTEPLASASRLHAAWLPAQWLWYVVLGLYLLLGVITLLWILVPRPRMARNAPRSPAYHVLAATVPGSGMADELWGILLLVPWGIFGVDLVWRLTGAGPLLDVPLSTVITVLAILYALNLAAFIVEFSSYRRRMRQLFRANPEAGIAYGRRIEPAAEAALTRTR